MHLLMELKNQGTAIPLRMSVACAFPHIFLSFVTKTKTKPKNRVSSCSVKRDGARLRAKLEQTKGLFSDSSV